MKFDSGVGWWHWLATVPLLIAGVSGRAWGIMLAMALCMVQIAHFAWRGGGLTVFPVQVRAAYLMLLGIGLWAPMQWLHWVQLVGTSARVVVGYCLLARILSLMPWNRFEPWSRDLIRHTFLTLQEARPCSGAAGYVRMPRLSSGAR